MLNESSQDTLKRLTRLDPLPEFSSAKLGFIHQLAGRPVTLSKYSHFTFKYDFLFRCFASGSKVQIGHVPINKPTAVPSALPEAQLLGLLMG